MTAAGLIFSNIHDSCIPELTSRRTMASIPFGGRYRLIDFALSNMVNSGITKVGLITQLQAEGGKRMAAADYFRGHPIEIN